MSHYQRDYTTLLHEQGFRVTPQRQLILDAICAGGGHTTFEEIYQRVQAKTTAINRATVYRTLDFLRELRLVVTADIGNSTVVYEIAGDTPHHHLVCRQCGAVSEIGHGELKKLFDQLQRDYGFSVDVDHLALFGQCAQCRKANKQGSGKKEKNK